MKSFIKQTKTFLEKPKGYKKSWLRIFSMFLISIIGFSILFSLTLQYGPYNTTSSVSEVSFSKNLFANAELSNAVASISIACFVFLVIPLIIIFSLWIIGVNQVSQSPYFHIMLWLIAFILISLLLISIIIFTRAAVYNFNDYA